jgi:hypothetical protein
VDEMGRACSIRKAKKTAYRVLVDIQEGTRSLGRCRHRWEDNIKMDLRDIGWDVMDWIQLAQNRMSGGLS